MFHKSHLGLFGDSIPCDLDGQVPEEGDLPTTFRFDHDDFVADFDDNGDGYEGYAQEVWQAFVDSAIEQTEKAKEALSEWRESTP